MIGEGFLRDFFGMKREDLTSGGFTNLSASFGRETVEKALALSRGCAPETNLMPFIQIVLDAKRLGLEISRKNTG